MEFLFLSGCQRSGKTLVQLILSSHPEVLITPGTKTIEQIIYNYRCLPLITGNDLDKVKEWIFNDNKLSAWNVDLNPFFKKLKTLTSIAPRDLIENIMYYLSESCKPDIRIIGNRKGFYSKDAQLVKELIPEAKFLFLMRDARGAVESMLKTQADQHDIYSASETWRLKAQRINQLKHQFENDCYILNYEKFVTSPELECRQLCSFLHIDYHPAMLNDYCDNSIVRHTDDYTHPETYQSITTDMINVWKKSLTHQQIQIIESITTEQLRNFKYEL